MNFPPDTPLFYIPALTGFIFVLTGIIMAKFPPRKINYFYGYRTQNSMKSEAHWQFAQSYASKTMTRYGMVLFFSSVIGLFYTPITLMAMALGLGMMFVTVILLFIKVEQAIKQEFREVE